MTCRGTKTFRWWNSDRTEVVEYQCNCTDQFILHRYLLNANVGLAYQRIGWADVEAEGGAVAKARAYLGRLGDYINAGCGLILYGERPGTGKTLLAILIAKEALAQGHAVHFVTFSEMVGMFTDSWHDIGEKTWFYRRVKNADLLVLDDLGREHKQRRFIKGDDGTGMRDFVTSTSEASFDEVLRHRVASSKPTLVTTNLTLDQIGQGYGGNVMSLLHERSSTYCFTGEDFRDRQRERLVDEIGRGLTRPVVIG